MKIGDLIHFRSQPADHCWPARVVISGDQPMLDVATDSGNETLTADGGHSATATSQNTWHLPGECPDQL